MSTLDILFHDKLRRFPEIFVLLSYRKNFVGTQKLVRINHGKRAIGVRAVEVQLHSYSGKKKKFLLEGGNKISAPFRNVSRTTLMRFDTLNTFTSWPRWLSWKRRPTVD